MTDFESFNLAQPLLRALLDEGYAEPTPIQSSTLPLLLAGRDIVGIAQTGTGKTAAFALPLLNRFVKDISRAKPRKPQALILAPTRELAAQIGECIVSYSRFLGVRSLVVFGGASIRPQIANLQRGVHVLVATPGRLLDLMAQGQVQLSAVNFFVLDEADRMLDMGFINDVRKIAQKLPQQRQTALFSATMPHSIEVLADALLTDPKRIEVAPSATTAEKVEQKVLFVRKEQKRSLLDTVLKDKSMSRVLVFTRTKHGANRVVRHLGDSGIKSDAIHGNKTQAARQRALKAFKEGRVRVLVATDIAARGIDVDGVTHVINFELPNDRETYIHRIGRTARAGNGGIALSFCDFDERGMLKDIEHSIRKPIEVFDKHFGHVVILER